MSEHGRSGKPAPTGTIGAILAGGRGRRIGGAKATVQLAGRPLISYPLAAMRSVLGEVAIVAKADTELPTFPGIEVWVEPPEPRHPLVGILEALKHAEKRPVLVAAADLPFLSAEAVNRLAWAEPAGAPAVIAAHGGAVNPLLGCYQPAAAQALGPVNDAEDRPLRELIAAIAPRVLELPAQDLFNVNTPDDLRRAAAVLEADRLSRT